MGALPAKAHAQASPQPRCRLGLALSGGGARGIAELGVLQAFQEAGVHVDCIAGASVGAIIGSLYASGYDLTSIERLVRELDWQQLYADPHNRNQYPLVHRLERRRTALRLGIDSSGVKLPRAFLNDYLVNRVLIEHLAEAGFAAGRDFSRLPISFRAVGTDLHTGARVVLASGDLGRAVRSSMSVPLAYPPVEWNEYLLVDGGLVDNIPVSLIAEMGAQFTVAVDVSTPITPEATPDVFGVTSRIIDLLYDAKNSIHYREPDLLIKPELGDHSFADYSDIDKLIDLGHAAASKAIEEIPAEYRLGPGGTAPAASDSAPGAVIGLQQRSVSEIRVSGNRYVNSDVLRHEFGMRPGDRLDLTRALRGLDHVFSSGLLDSAWLDFIPDGDEEAIVEIIVREQFRRTLDVGLAYQNDDQAQAYAAIELRNELGAGERLMFRFLASEKDLVLGVRVRSDQIFGSHFGYQIDIESHREKPKVYRDGALVNRAEFQRSDARILAVVPIASQHLIQLGFRFGEVDVDDRLGLDIPAISFQHRGLLARYLWDDLDAVILPTSGRQLTVNVERNLSGLNSTAAYWRGEASGRAIVTITDRWTLDARARFGYSSGALPIHEQFRLGGPDYVPGLDRDELWNNHLLAGSAAVGYELMAGARVTARLGAGNSWAEFGEVDPADLGVGAALGVIFSTPIGPLRFEYGFADGDRSELYVALGHQ